MRAHNLCPILTIAVLCAIHCRAEECQEDVCTDTCQECYNRDPRPFVGAGGPCLNGADDNLSSWAGSPSSMEVEVRREGDSTNAFFYLTVAAPSLDTVQIFDGFQLSVINLGTNAQFCLTKNLNQCTASANYTFTFCIGLPNGVYFFQAQSLPAPPPTLYERDNSIYFTAEAMEIEDVGNGKLVFFRYVEFNGSHSNPGASITIYFKPSDWTHYDVSLRLDQQRLYVRDESILLSDSSKEGAVSFSSLCSGRYFIEIKAIDTSQGCACRIQHDCSNCPRMSSSQPVQLFAHDGCDCTDAYECKSVPGPTQGSNKDNRDDDISSGALAAIIVSLFVLLILCAVSVAVFLSNRFNERVSGTAQRRNAGSDLGHANDLIHEDADSDHTNTTLDVSSETEGGTRSQQLQRPAESVDDSSHVLSAQSRNIHVCTIELRD